MGVPGFVSWLREYCKDIMILNSLMKKPKILYIDGNCLIHPKCFEVLEFCKDIKNIDKLENIMFERICAYISFLVDYVNPEECYFAVDGVAPVAKINQQRKRRYRSIDDANMKDELKSKYNINLDTKWSNIVITPGTDFMEKLHQHLVKYFENKAKLYKGKVKYVYSSYRTPGEGEHKILKDIRRRTYSDDDIIRSKDDDIYVIYGLDADLFFLAMASQKKNIYLLREEFHLVQGKPVKHEIIDPIDDVAEDMRYVSIDLTKKCYDDRIMNIIYQKSIEDGHEIFNLDGLDKEDYWNDFVFICYFLGNDFLPHFPSIDVHKSGLDIVIDCYTDIIIRLHTKLITVERNKSNTNIIINNIFLLDVLKELGEKEEQYFMEILPERNYYRQKKRCYASDEYSKKIWEIENMRFDINDPIKLGIGCKDEWKFRYYEYYFGVSEHYQEHVDLMAYCYIEGLSWVTKYYYDDCPSWIWQYPFTHAPFISDIYNYMKKSKLDINNINFVKSRPLTPYIQLISVLPPSCVNIMPQKYAHLVSDANSPIIDMFPTKVELDMIGKDMYWMCVPMLPYLDISRIFNAIKNIKLSKEETVRNKEIDDLHFIM